MNIAGIHYRTIWPTAEGAVRVIDQSRLPFEFGILELSSVEEAARAIRTMAVRGAPLIGATAAYGLALAARSDPSDASLDGAERMLDQTREGLVAVSVVLAHDGIGPGARRDGAAETIRYVELAIAHARAHGLTLEALA